MRHELRELHQKQPTASNTSTGEAFRLRTGCCTGLFIATALLIYLLSRFKCGSFDDSFKLS